MAEQVVRLHRAGAVRLAALPPLSLYLHLPWCLKKCPYCDFNSHESKGELPERVYVDALVADLEASLPQVWGRRITSVFVGGGTPSLFSPAAIDRLLAAMRARLPLEPGCEVTLEANPGTFERERFRAYREAGVTRLSIGVQSFDDASLRAIGRVHDARQALAAVDEAARTFETFNLDLMYALPGQMFAALERDLAQALAFAPPHLSVYHLTLEPNTAFATRPPAGLPDDDTASAMLDAIVERTAAAGLARYEVSAFARAGHRCVHNLNYWRFGDYLGLGAGAHGKLSFPDRIVRQVRWRDPATYLQRVAEGRAVSNEHTVSADELPFEFVLNALRLREGFALPLFAERTGLSPAVLDDALQVATARGLVERDGAIVRPSARGFDFLSDLQALFLPDATRPTRG
ncbi:MAG: radical SAM family heme chaperone HemW [Burkholderiaceae bacterium]|nr:radical SAM family heme chaperone HemW [Burkholderiaceae bacterium]